jgi:hypothetical protein
MLVPIEARKRDANLGIFKGTCENRIKKKVIETPEMIAVQIPKGMGKKLLSMFDEHDSIISIRYNNSLSPLLIFEEMGKNYCNSHPVFVTTIPLQGSTLEKQLVSTLKS